MLLFYEPAPSVAQCMLSMLRSARADEACFVAVMDRTPHTPKIFDLKEEVEEERL